jgi:Fe-S cluster assembly protein SufD
MNMTQDSAIPLYEEVVNGFNKLLSASAEGGTVRESSDLRKARQSAFDKFREIGFPTIKNEDWRYTNIARFLKEEYSLISAPDVDSPALKRLVKAATIPSLDCYRIVMVNGVLAGKIEGGELPGGIQILTVAEAKQDPALSGYFEKTAEWEKHHFATLNAAMFSDGLFIRADAGAIAEKPFHIIHIFTGDRNLLIQPRHVWIVNRNAELSVIESVISSDSSVSSVGGGVNHSGATISTNGLVNHADGGLNQAAGGVKIWANTLTEIILQHDAKLDHTMIQTAGAGVRMIQHTTVRQKKQSLYNNYTFTLPGADLVRNDLQTKLEEDHTESHLYGLYLAAGNQLVDNHTLVDHQKPACLSNELYKGVLLEQSTGVFNGKVYVHKDAQKTNAFQQNNNLVISKKATIDSKPQLEIYADDVKCSHGTTVGQFSEEALFYLRSRGIGEESAKCLLINAFAFDVTEKIKIPAVETHINELISHHIPVMHA